MYLSKIGHEKNAKVALLTHFYSFVLCEWKAQASQTIETVK